MNVFSRLGHWLGPAPAVDPATRRAVERAVDMAEPLLQTVPKFRQRLAPAVSRALAYCEQLVDAVPGPVEISSRAFGADPLVHALFATPADVGEMLGRSRELSEFMAEPPADGGAALFALLGMRRHEKLETGMALRGDALQGDVPQRILYFSDHTLGALGGDLQTTRERLREAAFDSLAKGFAARVAELRRQRDDARIAWEIERASTDAGRRERLQALEERQRQAIAALTPEGLLDDLAACLAAPEGRLRLKRTAVTVDRMGVIAGNPAQGGSVSTLDLAELVARDRRQWTVFLVRISRPDAEEALARRQQASRYIII